MSKKLTIDKEMAIEVDHFFESFCLSDGDPFQYIIDYSKENNLPAINVAPLQGKMLHLFVKMMGATSVLEIGTLGGYSTAWLASAVSETGCVESIDFDIRHIQVATHTLTHVGLMDKVRLHHGYAIHVLEQMIQENRQFDFIFIDADKEHNPEYLNCALKLSHVGTVIVADNVARNGKVILETSKANNINGLRRFFQEVKNTPQLSATAVQTLSVKGWDGFALLRVESL